MKCLLLYLFLIWNLSVVIGQSVNIQERPRQHEPSHNFDVLHYRIALNFDGKNHAFEGQTAITFRSLSQKLDRITLHAESYKVQSVTFSEGEDLSFEHEGGVLDISLFHPIGYGDTVSLQVNYGTENFDVDPTEFGMASSYPLGIGFFDAKDEQPFLFNAYSFPTGARHWFPCYDHPNDRATHETIITSQANHKVLANGLLQSVTENANGTVTYHWTQNQPHPTYLYNFVSGPYTILEDSYQDIPVNYWVYPKDEDRGLRSFHRTPEVLAFFADYYGVTYPWDKFDQIIVPGIGGGAEATTATLIGASTLHDDRAEQDFPSHWLVAHEAAHHWWGDLISYRDWSETWMSESFATYSEYLFSNHLYGPEEGALNLDSKRQAYLNEAKNRYKRPIVFNKWEYPNQNFDRHTYQKGALVLHMLSEYLGENNFKRVLKHFLTTHAYQPVDTHDFIKSIWEVTGQNMNWFFDQWIYAAGHPILDIKYEWIEKQVILTVEQIQDTSDNIPIFNFPVDMAIHTDAGIVEKTIWIHKKESTHIIDVDMPPKMVRFDPDHVILKEWTFNKSKEELLYQAQNGEVRSRIWAIGELATHTNDEQVNNILMNISKTDAFWAIRRAALMAAVKEESEDLRIMCESALSDAHSHVRAEAIKILGETKQSDLQGLFRKVYQEDNSYVVQAEAIRALGKLKLTSDKALFEEVLQLKSPRNLFSRAGKWALAQLEAKG